MRRTLLPALTLILSCADGVPATAETVLAADTTRTGIDGNDGAGAVSRIVLHTQARVTDTLDVEVTFPSSATGGPYPAVVFVQGGFVATERYRWLATHLATRGYVVAMPAHVADLAFFATDDATLALAALRDASSHDGPLAHAVDPSAPAFVMGHSLGGVVAIRQWITGAFYGVVGLAAYPADGDPVVRQSGHPVLLLVGANDTRKATAEKYRAGLDPFSIPRLFGRVDDMNHYAWTDGASASELAGDGPTGTRPLAEARRSALAVLDDWLDAYAKHYTTAVTRLDRGAYEHVEIAR